MRPTWRIIRGKKVAILGYGSQGHAHALNLKDSGVDVRVGLPASSRRATRRGPRGLTVGEPGEVTKWADVVMVLVPDTTQAQLYKEQIAPNLSPGNMLMFAHGFNIRFGTIVPRADIDVAMVAPKAPGHRVRELFQEGAGTPALFAVHQDATGQARAADAVVRQGHRRDARRRHRDDVCGRNRNGPVRRAGGPLRRHERARQGRIPDARGRGVSAGSRVFRVLHELKLIVDLMYQGGLNYMRYSVSDTAEHGDYTGGPEDRDGRDEAGDEEDARRTSSPANTRETGSPRTPPAGRFNKTRDAEQNQLIEQVGARLRSLMPFLKPVTVKQDTGNDSSGADGY